MWLSAAHGPNQSWIISLTLSSAFSTYRFERTRFLRHVENKGHLSQPISHSHLSTKHMQVSTILHSCTAHSLPRRERGSGGVSLTGAAEAIAHINPTSPPPWRPRSRALSRIGYCLSHFVRISLGEFCRPAFREPNHGVWLPRDLADPLPPPPLMAIAGVAAVVVVRCL